METLTTAQGYFDLGLFTEAWEILDALPGDIRVSRNECGLRLRILDATERWEQCQFLTEALVQHAPSWPLPRLLGAKALDKQGEIESALAFLTLGEVVLQDEPGFWYQLGSYRARLGDVIGAKQAIARLAELAPEWRLKMLEDPAFESVL
jgi:predicted Zn-dependent protease